MRTDHCSAARCAAAPSPANLSGCASRCRSFQRAAMAAESCAKRCVRPNRSKSLDCRFTGGGRLDAERLSAAAAVPLVRVVEAKTFVQAFAHEVQLRAVDIGEALGVDQQLHAVV